MLRRLRQWRPRGSSLAWTAILLAVGLLPLMMLLTDAIRLFYADIRLSLATDAACEAALQAAYENAVPQFKQTGYRGMVWDSRAARVGAYYFQQALQDAGLLENPHFVALPVSDFSLACRAQATVSTLLDSVDVRVGARAYADGTFRAR